jgi:hypothetical protein
VYAVATSPEASAAPARRPARDLIELVLEHMRRNLEPLKYSTLAPSRYVVYLHAAEYARLEGILGIIQQQTIRALNEELTTLNEGTGLQRYARRVWKRSLATVENAAPEWHVEFRVDPDGDLQPGDVLVDSELMLPPALSSRWARARDASPPSIRDRASRVRCRYRSCRATFSAISAISALFAYSGSALSAYVLRRGHGDTAGAGGGDHADDGAGGAARARPDLVRRRHRHARLHGRQSLGVDRARRRGLPGRRAHHVVDGRVP